MNGEGCLQACGFLLDFGLCRVSHWSVGLGTTGTAQLHQARLLLLRAVLAELTVTCAGQQSDLAWPASHVLHLCWGSSLSLLLSSLQAASPTKPARLQVWSCPWAGAAARAGWALAEAAPARGDLLGWV